MKQNFTIPAWLLAVAIFSQLILGVLTARLVWENANPPKVWALDSTTYYKFLEGQGKLNLRLYEQTQSHEERLRALDKKRKATHRHIDSLSGDALQREIDRQYNSRQSTSGTGPKDRSETDPANGSGRSTGPEGQSRSDHAARGRILPGYVTPSTASGYSLAESDHPAVKRAPAAGKEPGHDCPEPGRRLPDQVARSQTGDVDVANRASRIHRRSAEAHIAYWLLIRAQGYTYPDIAWAISAVETGYWSPKAAIMKQNNLFAFKVNSRKNYVAIGKQGYVVFSSRVQCLADYGAYEKQVIAKYDLQTRQAYLNHICLRFCPNPAYRGKLALAFQTLKALT